MVGGWKGEGGGEGLVRERREGGVGGVGEREGGEKEIGEREIGKEGEFFCGLEVVESKGKEEEDRWI